MPEAPFLCLLVRNDLAETSETDILILKMGAYRMNLGELFFSWRGEISRMPYFLASLGLWFAMMVVLIVVAVTVFGSAAMSNTAEAFMGSLAIFLVVLIPLFCLWMYCGTVLIIKRLHDIGLSGLHVLWIYGLGFFASAFSISDTLLLTMISLLFSIAQLCAYLWLLFMPGQSSNYAHAFE
tara:strand:- start:242 stop:784 length:543 start_codon:yes stop_codon:yes gene_type:complete